MLQSTNLSTSRQGSQRSEAQILRGRWHEKRAFALAGKNERNPDNVGMSTLKGYAPSWIRLELWDDLVDKVWSTDGWKAKSKTGKKNRATLVNGSVKKKLTREPTIVEVFKETHCKKIILEDGTISYGEFIHPKAAMTLLKLEGGDKGQFYKARKQDQKKEQCRITKHDKERIARLSKTVAMARRLIPIFFP
ncbi:hypothetical protein L6452_17547 [Arctium lappa]|uniref:Uncharacterized protein n=1 Tax=Arctium lappa TaxID=4217 RepID=A0ACB9C3Q2_ARCLA|nr:hypothetical protein L6452_17547 [Arctium lappa]